MSYQEKDNQVILTMSRDDWNFLLMCLGAATVTFGNPTLMLANRLNLGNPDWTPYEETK
jgi:hypothetical protein